jgi:uncharacterized protein (TIGR04255 family)
VVEVSLCFQFAAQSVDLDVLAMFSERVRAELPRRELQPALPSMVERFDAIHRPPAFEFRLEQLATLPRVWFTSTDSIRLVQLQHDRLTLNWRKLDTDERYPRYRELRQAYAGFLESLHGCYEALERARPVINMAEVAYINHIDDGVVVLRNGQPGFADPATIINRLAAPSDRAFLAHVEDVQVNERWRIPRTDGSDEPAGRLYLAAGPGIKPSDGQPIYVVNLTARVLPATSDDDSVWAAMDRAHRYVVLGFKDTTTEHMHRLWGLQQ